MAENEGLRPQMSLPTKIDDDCIDFRRKSTGKKASSISGDKPVPHYLRASTGSCHDLCKHGHRNVSEEKLKRPIPRRPAAKPTDSHVLLDTVASLGKKKSLNTTRSLDSLNFSEPNAIRERKKVAPLVKNRVEVSSKPLKLEAFLLKKEKNSSAKRLTSLKSKLVISELNGKKTVTSRVASTKVSRKLTVETEQKTLSPCKSPGDDVEEFVEPKKTESHEVEEKTLYVVKTESEDNNSVDLDRCESCAQEFECVAESRNEGSAIELDQKEADVESIVEMENGDDALESDQSKRIVEIRTDNDTLEPDPNETFEEAVVVESLPSQPSSLSGHPSSSSSSLHEVGEDQDEEFEYTTSEFGDDTLSENSEAESTETRDPSNVRDDKKGLKMKFRRGTVVEIRDEDNAPRRLRFRRGRVLGKQDAGPGGRRRGLERREFSGDDDDDIGEENGSERVVLKHQDVQESKRDARGLFNLVIKETVSKLAESRKSKVKALVGAFETVISLQDAKLSSASVS